MMKMVNNLIKSIWFLLKENLNNFFKKVDTEILASNNLNEDQYDKTDTDTYKFEDKKSFKEEQSFNDLTITSLHDDNWIFLDRKPSSASSLSSQSSKNKLTHSIISPNQNDLDETNISNDFAFTKPVCDILLKGLNISPSSSTYFNPEEATIRSLTNSSCHSERSMARLNCLTLSEESSTKEKEIDEPKKEDDTFVSTYIIDMKLKSDDKPTPSLIKSKIFTQPKRTFQSKNLDQNIEIEDKKPEVVKNFFSNINKLKSISEEKQLDFKESTQQMSKNTTNNSIINRKCNYFWTEFKIYFY